MNSSDIFSGGPLRRKCSASVNVRQLPRPRRIRSSSSSAISLKRLRRPLEVSQSDKLLRLSRRNLFSETAEAELQRIILWWATAQEVQRVGERATASAPENHPREFLFGDLAEEFTTEETQVLVALTY